MNFVSSFLPRRILRSIPLVSLAALIALLILPTARAQTLFVSVNGGGTIQEVTSDAVSVFASGFTHPNGVAYGPDGNLYVSEVPSGTDPSFISKITPGGTVSIFAPNFQNPIGLTFDNSGNLYVADYGRKSIYQVTSGAVVSTYATGLNSPFSVAFNSSGLLYAANRDNGTVVQVASNGTVSAFASGFSEPNDLVFDNNGNLYVTNFNGSTISKVSPDGLTISTFADSGDGLSAPVGIAFDAVTGHLFVANQGNNSIVELALDGTASLFANGISSAPQYLTVASAVPEPATTASLMGALVLGLGLTARRRSRRSRPA